MQAITVLLLELTQRTSRHSRDPFYLFACVENLVQWLKALKAVDSVAENAYCLVCDMLRKYKRFAKDQVPEQWLPEETAEHSDHAADPFADATVSIGGTFMTDMQYTPQQSTHPFHTSEDDYTSRNEEPLPSNSLDDDSEGLFFGQAHYTPYYSSQFTTPFDQEMGDERGNNYDEEGWNPPYG